MSKKNETANQAEKDQALEEAKTIIAEQSAMIDELAAKLSSAPKSNTPTVEIEGINYQVASGARVKGRNISAGEIAQDLELCKLLLKINSSIIKPIS